MHAAAGHDYAATTDSNGKFAIADIAAGAYEVSIKSGERDWKLSTPLVVSSSALTVQLQIPSQGQELRNRAPHSGKLLRKPAGANIFRRLRFRVSRSMRATSASYCFSQPAR